MPIDLNDRHFYKLRTLNNGLASHVYHLVLRGGRPVC